MHNICLKQSKIVQICITDFPNFIKMVTEHINTILHNNPGQKLTARYGLWQPWLDDDLLDAINLHIISVVIDFPTTGNKTHKHVAQFILEELVAFDQFTTCTYYSKHRIHELDKLEAQNGNVLDYLLDGHWHIHS